MFGIKAIVDNEEKIKIYETGLIILKVSRYEMGEAVSACPVL